MTAVTARSRCLGYPLKCSLFLAALFASLASAPIRAEAETRSLEVETVRAVLSQPESKLDFLAAATAFDAYEGAEAANTKASRDIRDTDSAAINPDSLLDW